MSREKQRLRTRNDLLEAAARLIREGRQPGFEEIAEAALVSRATAYRYFPGVDALLREAALHVAVPTPDTLFAGDDSADPVARMERLDAALFAMLRENEPGMRALLVASLQAPAGGDTPTRQNRRSPLIAAALDPARDRFDPDDLAKLEQVLAVLVGVEAMVVFKDVLGASDAAADAARRWAIRALVEAALRR
jgi:AcrR family transcriptional regulator